MTRELTVQRAAPSDELRPHGIAMDGAAEDLPTNLFADSSPSEQRSTARRAARGAMRAFGRSAIGRRLIQVALGDRANLAWFLYSLSDRLALQASFDETQAATTELRGFEDCNWLFSSNALSHGLSRLDLDEAAYLFRLVRALDGPRVAEIGRFKGGSTLLLAAAGARVVSIDSDRDQIVYAPALARALERHGLREAVEIVIGDSRSHPVNPESFDVVFLDGDHRYEGVKADLEHWWPALVPGGHLLLHDAMTPPQTITPAPEAETIGVQRLVAELEHWPGATRRTAERAGTFAHFVKET